jgi:two-component system LytT family response regulator
MNPIKVLIVDDEKLARRAVRVLLEKDADVQVVGEAADGEEAASMMTRLRPDLVFLDVQMPLVDGVLFLKSIPAAERPYVVFVTAFDQHAVQAFEFHAIDYLVKPFSDERFFKALRRAKERLRGGDQQALDRVLMQLQERITALSRTQPGPLPATPAQMTERLVVKADGEMHFIDQHEIRWIEGQGDFVRIHTPDKRILSRITMQRMVGMLNPAIFLRVHKSSIVNLKYVRRLKPVLARSLGVELDDGTVLPVGRSYRLDLEKVL